MKNLGLSITTVFLCACANYSLFLNDNALYQPPSMYLDFDVADPQLETCLVQHIEEILITSPRDLIQLNCSYGGIVTLEGLNQFSRIEHLSLKGNPLADIEAIFQLVNLNFVDVSDANLTCNQISSLQDLPLDQLISPGNC
jgi:hypothetical protein|tara:strand:- start:73100 stop:73522 length:423 start_codon:yes stop_codon:yes gene_type:complete